MKLSGLTKASVINGCRFSNMKLSGLTKTTVYTFDAYVHFSSKKKLECGVKLQIVRDCVTPISSQIQLQIPLPTYPSTLISGQIPPTYLPLDV
eukprot:Pgem_evm1s41